MPHVLRHRTPAERRTSIRCALYNAGLWGAGSGLVSVTLIRYLANEFGASALAIAWILAAPEIAGTLRLFAPWWVRRVGSRKKFCVVLFTVSALGLLALPLISAPHVLPHAGESLAALGGLWLAYHVLEFMAAVALWSWMGDLTPAAIRGRFFGRRESWLNAGKALGMLVAALASYYWTGRCETLDRPHDEWMSYAACALAGAACYLLAVIPLTRIAEQPDWRENAEQPLPLKSLLAPLFDPKYRRLLLFGVWFSAANGLFYSVRSLYEMREIGLPFFHKKLLDAGSRGVQSRLSPAAGRLVDRRGNVPVLVVTQCIISMAPLFYVLASPDAMWWIVGAYVCWLAYAGENVAQPNLMIGLSPRDQRSNYIAVWFAAKQLAVAGGIFVGARLRQWLLAGAASPSELLVAAPACVASAVPGGTWPAATLFAGAGDIDSTGADRLAGLLIAAAVLQLAGAWWARRIPEPQIDD